MMNDISIFTLTSKLHDAKVVGRATEEFLRGLNIAYDFKDNDYDDYGKAPLSLIFVRTGGTENLFRELLPRLRNQSQQPIYLLTSGKSNSLAASMEILSYLRQHAIKGEIIHGNSAYVHNRVLSLVKVEMAKKALRGQQLGVIGKPSDWLIASDADYDAIQNRLGIHIVDIPMAEMLEAYNRQTDRTDALLEAKAPTEAVKKAIPGALRIYDGMKELVRKHVLNGLTIRCFDLLTAVHDTGCIGLAKLNSEQIVAGCEGDVPSALSMMIALALTGTTGFQSNPAHIDVETGELMFAHCTINLNMVDRFELDTHFESGIGVGIRGYMHGPVTIFKMSGDGQRYYAEEGEIQHCDDKPNLCRTQVIVQLDDKEKARYFLTDPIGNHHILIPGRHKAEIDEFMRSISMP